MAVLFRYDLVEGLGGLALVLFLGDLLRVRVASAHPELVSFIHQACANPRTAEFAIRVDALRALSGFNVQDAGCPINLRIRFSKPGEAEDDVLGAYVGDEEVPFFTVFSDGEVKPCEVGDGAGGDWAESSVYGRLH